MKRLTTAEAAERLGVAQVTVNVWCLRGLFPNATREETARGPVWTIPEIDVAGFVKPKRGRVPKMQANGAGKKGGKK
jgi:predicted site-specific integrase-resolvase